MALSLRMRMESRLSLMIMLKKSRILAEVQSLGRNIRESEITGDYFKEVLEHERIINNEEIKFKDQSDNLVVCLFDAQPVYEENKMIGAFGQFRDISERYLLQEQYNYLAFHDELTKLPNRRFMKKEIETIIQEIT